MHKNSKLNWQSLPWQDFQFLTLHLAQNLIPGCNFEIFLKEGHKQQGIDIISSIGDDGKYVFIQCKREKSLSKTQIQNIIDLFISESFGKKTSTFILATTADLQKPGLQEFILKIRDELYNKHKIKFETWDDTFISEQLRPHRNLVQFYFSEKDAIEHCFPIPDISGKPKNNSILNFIPRKVIEFTESEDHYNDIWRFHQREKFLFADVIRKNRLLSKQICLIADAYQGKTFLLIQTAWELENGPLPFKCLYIQIKSHNIKPVREAVLLAGYCTCH